MVTALIGAGACGGGESVERPRNISVIRDVGLPARVLGLEVRQEPVIKFLKGVDRPYIDAAGLFSFREGDLLQALLQVGRFAAEVDASNPTLRRTIAGQILGGGTKLTGIRVGGRTVFLGGSTRQILVVWFEGRTFLVLTVLGQYPKPRTLLRKLLELEVGRAVA